jgi:hypothetical protein
MKDSEGSEKNSTIPTNSKPLMNYLQQEQSKGGPNQKTNIINPEKQRRIRKDGPADPEDDIEMIRARRR